MTEGDQREVGFLGLPVAAADISDRAILFNVAAVFMALTGGLWLQLNSDAIAKRSQTLQ